MAVSFVALRCFDLRAVYRLLRIFPKDNLYTTVHHNLRFALAVPFCAAFCYRVNTVPAIAVITTTGLLLRINPGRVVRARDGECCLVFFFCSTHMAIEASQEPRLTISVSMENKTSTAMRNCLEHSRVLATMINS